MNRGRHKRSAGNVLSRFADKEGLGFKPFVCILLFVAVVCVAQLLFFFVANKNTSMLALGLLSTVAIIAMAVVLQVRPSFEKRVDLVVLAAMLVLGMGYSVVFAPMTVPDEDIHYSDAYRYSNYVFGITESNEDGCVPVRNADYEFEKSFNTCLTGTDYKQEIKLAMPLFLDGNASQMDSMSYEGSSPSPPQVRIPAAIGITLARVLGLNSLVMFYLGRMFNFLAFAFLAFWAMLITPVLKNAFRVIPLLPMVLHVCSSYSYDAMTLGLALVLSALCFEGVFGSSKLGKEHIAKMAVIAFLLAPCKVIYTLVSFGVLLIPCKRFGSFRKSLASKAVVLFAALAGIAIFSLPHIMSMFVSPAPVDSGSGSSEVVLDKRGDQTGTFYSINDIMTNPAHAFMVFSNSLLLNFETYVTTALGYSLGWFQENLRSPLHIWMPFLFAIAISVLKTEDDLANPSAGQRIAFGAIAFVCMICAMYSMFVGHTFNFEHVVMGVQGRYMLPVVPFFLLAIRPSRMLIEGKRGLQLTLFLIASNLVYLCWIYGTVLNT